MKEKSYTIFFLCILALFFGLVVFAAIHSCEGIPNCRGPVSVLGGIGMGSSLIVALQVKSDREAETVTDVFNTDIPLGVSVTY